MYIHKLNNKYCIQCVLEGSAYRSITFINCAVKSEGELNAAFSVFPKAQPNEILHVL